MDTQQDIRSEMVLEMQKMGIMVEKQHHEVATAGQAEIDMRYDSLTNMADKMMMYKYIIKNVARRHGKTVTLMPKPLFQDNGSGMHTRHSIWNEGRPLFAGTEYAGVSQLCLWDVVAQPYNVLLLRDINHPSDHRLPRLTACFVAPRNAA